MIITGNGRKRYAGATTGGISYMIDINVEPEQFPSLKDRTGALNIVVSVADFSVNYSICSKLISEDGSTSHWREETKLTDEEHSIISEWIANNNIRKDAMMLAREYETTRERWFEKMDECIKKMEESSDNDSLEDFKARRDDIDSLNNEADQMRKRLDELQDMAV
jgi:polyhydroxyalkanoate synthesis regulator phasin